MTQPYSINRPAPAEAEILRRIGTVAECEAPTGAERNALVRGSGAAVMSIGDHARPDYLIRPSCRQQQACAGECSGGGNDLRRLIWIIG